MQPTDPKDYWDDHADTVHFTIPLKEELVRRYIPSNARILDYGCGYGRTLQQLWEIGYRNLLGVDFSAGMITRGRSLYPHLELHLGNAGGLPRDSPPFDLILLFAVLTCIPDDRDQQMLITNLDRLLRPGGMLYVSDFLLADDPRNRERYEKFHEKYGTYGVFELEEGAVVRHHDPVWVQQLFSAFKGKEYGVETFTTMLGHPAQGFYYLGQKYKRIPIGRS
jgi:SAM-dependent methyltransferase